MDEFIKDGLVKSISWMVFLIFLWQVDDNVGGNLAGLPFLELALILVFLQGVQGAQHGELAWIVNTERIERIDTAMR